MLHLQLFSSLLREAMTKSTVSAMDGPDHDSPLGATIHAGCHQCPGHATKCKFFAHSNFKKPTP